MNTGFKKPLTITDPLPKIIPAMMAKSLDNLETDIQQKNREAFIKNFGALADACNNCHIAVKYDFIVIQRPSAPEYSNMTFDIKKASDDGLKWLVLQTERGT